MSNTIVFKGKQSDDRGLVTSITSKMIEHIIVSSMWQNIDKYNLINNNQHGFHKRFSTTTQLLDVIDVEFVVFSLLLY